MSGFSADWLALREEADHRARNPAVAAALQDHFRSSGRASIVDLGSGAGSNLRALAPLLPLEQEWRLVDYDPALLAAARRRISAWADTVEEDGRDLHVVKDGRHLSIAFCSLDLAAGVAEALAGAPDLVTAAALFDLASVTWIEALAAAVAARAAAFATFLTYDGTERWTPPHPADDQILAAFHGHQQRDKGLGPAAGPMAATALESAFRQQGYRSSSGCSPWQLESPRDAALIAALAQGVAQAVRETGTVPEAAVDAWLGCRRSAAACQIGHSDLLAVPGR